MPEMTLERLLEKRNTTNVSLFVAIDRITMSRHSIRRSKILPQQFNIQDYIDVCNFNSDCGDCYCNCN